jgi:hypothetical protein
MGQARDLDRFLRGANLKQAAGEKLYPSNRPTTDADLASDDGKALEDAEAWNERAVAQRGERERQSDE